MNTESAKKMISYYLLVVGIKHPLLMFMPPFIYGAEIILGHHV